MCQPEAGISPAPLPLLPLPREPRSQWDLGQGTAVTAGWQGTRIRGLGQLGGLGAELKKKLSPKLGQCTGYGTGGKAVTMGWGHGHGAVFQLGPYLGQICGCGLLAQPLFRPGLPLGLAGVIKPWNYPCSAGPAGTEPRSAALLHAGGSACAQAQFVLGPGPYLTVHDR